MFEYRAGRGELRIFGKTLHLPQGRLTRIVLGVLLILLGVFGFLPVLGFWMIPVGLLVLSQDLPRVRRWRRALQVRYGRWRDRRRNGADRSSGEDG